MIIEKTRYTRILAAVAKETPVIFDDREHEPIEE